MKLKSGIYILLLAATLSHAQTNSLTSLLQQGLLEEQANRNLAAAIADYSTLAAQFDKDRQLAATAVFRLGECYRAQGKTNEAAAQYQRVLHDFPDQPTLATLSRQNLAGIGVMAATGNTTATSAAANSLSVTDAEDREIARIQKTIQNSPDLINSEDGQMATRTPLITAAWCGWLNVAAYLLDHGADVNRSAADVVQSRELADAGHTSPLLAAVAAGNKAMTQFLIEHGADVNFKGENNGVTPLHLAARKGFQAVAEVLLANHANPDAKNNAGQTPLFSAVQGGQIKIMQMLIAAGANPNLKDGKENTVLNFAIKTSPEVFQTLLTAGANPNTEDSDGRSPLSYAVERDSEKVVKLLLDAKANPNGGHKDVPLLTAIYKNNLATAEMLLHAGANPNVKSDIHWQMRFGNGYYPDGLEITPLFLAVINDQLPMVQLLLKFKADPNDAQMNGRAVMFNALIYPEILKALLDAGAKVEVRDETDSSSSGGSGSFLARLNRISNPDLKRTPLLFAAGGESNVVAVSELLQQGANPNTSDGRGSTALHWAAMGLADEQVFTQLLEHKANPNVRNIDGKTPLDLVKERLGIQIAGSRFPNQDQFGGNYGEVSPAQKSQAEKLITLLRQHGALDNLPDWNRITISRQSANASATVFQKNTNDWNHFTLLELLLEAYPNPGQNHFGDALLRFPDLNNIVIVRPSSNGKASKRIPVNLLDVTNGVDCTRDLPLEFGDVVEIPEREHTLAEGATYLNRAQTMSILNYLRNKSGEAKLVAAGSQTVSLPLQPMYSEIGQVLSGNDARAALTSKSDLSQIKVIRSDAATGKMNAWILDCSKMVNGANAPDLWLRNGDMMEVPEKP